MATREPLPWERLSWGPMAQDWQTRVNMERLRRDRFKRTQEQMKKRGIAAAILTGENQRYATAIKVPTIQMLSPDIGGFAVVFADYPLEDSIIYITGQLAIQLQQHVGWIKPENIRWCYKSIPSMGRKAVWNGQVNQAKLLRQDLEEKKLLGEKLAIGPVSAGFRAAFEQEGMKLDDMGDMMVEARKIKTEDEISCMKMVGAISNALFWKVYENLRPGISECELGAEVAKEWFRWQSMSVFEVSLSSGPNTSPNYIACRPSDRIIEPGDLVYLDLVGPVFSGYRSCCYRVFKCGTKPTEKEKDWYKKAYDWLYAGLEYLKPGNTSADVAKQWPKCEIWGNVSEHQASPNCVGHGLGLGQHEYPFIGRMCSLDDPQPIEEGMVVALETWHGEYGVGGCRIENVYLVTKDGYEVTQGSWPDEEITVPSHSLITG